MLRSILVAQLLTALLDTQGADPADLLDVFPEEFAPRAQRSERSHHLSVPTGDGFSAWSGASEDLTDSLRFLVERHLVTIHMDGHVVASETNEAADFDAHAVSPDDRYAEGDPVSPPVKTCEAPMRELGARERGERLGFERRRLES